MRCSSCGTDNPAGMKFCGNCAAPIKNQCLSCGFENPPQFKFCGECGVSLTAAPEEKAAAAPARSSARSSEHVASVRVAPELPESEITGGERKTVTALFADIKGS